MKASRARLTECKTSEECDLMIERIEADPDNYNGSWFSGYGTPMKKAASNKIEKLHGKSYKLFVKENPVSECEECLGNGEEACVCC